MAEPTWYNTDKINKHAPDALINFIIGARRIGKTFHFQQKAIDNWLKNGKQTLWLRNKKTEFDSPFAEDFMNGLVSIGYDTSNYIPKPHGLYDGDDLMIKFQSVSTFSNIRGNAYPNINLVVFDEFCPEDRRYPRNAHTGLLSITKTILSGKQDAKVYCLSNYVSVANPYFVGFGIYPHEKYDVTYFKDKKVCIEVCRGYRCDIEATNAWNDVYKAGSYGNYAEAKEDELWSLISPAPRNTIRHPYYIKSDGVVYAADYNDSVIYFHPCNPEKGGIVMGRTLQDCNAEIGIIRKDMIDNLKMWNARNVIRYSDANTMFVILKIIYSEV